jgi:hypothetical protein
MIIGFPWNIFVALPMIYLIYNAYVFLCKHIEYLPIVQLHPYYLLYLWVATAGILGAHLNGIIVVSFLANRQKLLANNK